MTVAGAVKSGTEFHTTSTVRHTMIATSAMVNAGSNGVRMDPRVRGLTAALHSRHAPSAYSRACEWIGLELRLKPGTVKDMLNSPHSIYEKLATFNRGLLRFGCTEKLAECMSHVDASMLGENVPAAKDAMHEHKVADASEDVEQAEFERNPCAETWERWRMKLCKEAYRIQDVIASHDEEYR
jgi:hypothetical protein